jgi:hypothetical protein
MLQLTLFDLYEAGSSFIVPDTRVAKLIQFYFSTVTSGKTFRSFLTCHLSGRDTGGVLDASGLFFVRYDIVTAKRHLQQPTYIFNFH